MFYDKSDTGPITSPEAGSVYLFEIYRDNIQFHRYKIWTERERYFLSLSILNSLSVDNFT